MPDGTKRYFDPATNLMVTGEYQIDGNKYLFDGEGIMQFGVQKTNGVSKYYDPETGILKTGWIDTADGKLYFNEETGDQGQLDTASDARQ